VLPSFTVFFFSFASSIHKLVELIVVTQPPVLVVDARPHNFRLSNEFSASSIKSFFSMEILAKKRLVCEISIGKNVKARGKKKNKYKTYEMAKLFQTS
jgi:hypothetical protein